jgi:uncharacterized damage-inducible protein DinB
MSVLPPVIAETFRTVPADVIKQCRPHSWEQLTSAPAPGMKSVREILVHMMGTEAFWLHHVVDGKPLRRPDPASFGSLESILAPWSAQRDATMSWLETQGPGQLSSTRTQPGSPSKSATVADIIWHVVTHEQYHRGQIFTRLAFLGRRDLPDNDLLR